MINRSELHCHTKMSLMSGVSDVRDLIQKAKKMGMHAIAITDNDTVQAFPEAFRECWDISGIKVILGIEVCIVDDVKNKNEGTNYKVIIIPKNVEGMKVIYKIISEANTNSSEKNILIPRKMLLENKANLFVGSCAEGGEVSNAVFNNQPDDNVRKIIVFYDFVEVEPTENYIWTLSKSSKKDNLTANQVQKNIYRIIKLGKAEEVPVVASSNVYYKNKADLDAFKVLRHACGYKDTKGWKAKHHLMSEKELLEEFSFLGEKTAREIVIKNSNKVAAKMGLVQPISPEKQYPVDPYAYLKLYDICYKRAYEIYGDKLPKTVESRLKYELNGIKQNDFASIYMIVYELVKKSYAAGYPVGRRGCSGSSLVSFLAGITDTNPLPAHYLCNKCKYSDFDVMKIKGYQRGNLGADLPKKKCPVCGSMLSKEGFDLPVETFLGFNLDKEPDFDINFAPEYLHEAQCSVADIDGIGEIYRAGTIGTFTEMRALSYAKSYFEGKQSRRTKESISKVAKKLVGVRWCNGKNPGGIIVVPKGVDISEYTPVVDCCYDDIPQTLIDYHSIDGKLLKIDILGHNAQAILKELYDETGIDPYDIQFGNDNKVLSLFSSTEALGICPSDIKGITVGTLGIPEYGPALGLTSKVLELIRPKRLSDIIKITSMMHGAQVWFENAEIIVKNNPELFSECLASRDDIMLYLIDMGFEPAEAFSIMENVRKGKVAKGMCDKWDGWKEEMKNHNVPNWYIWSCEQILYMYPKAHAAANAMMAWRLLYYKLYYPEEFYKSWFKIYENESLLEKDYEYASKRYEKLAKISEKFLVNKYEKMRECLLIMEMHARGIHSFKKKGQRRKIGEITPINKAVMDSLMQIEKTSKRYGEVTGVATDFIDLDRRTTGFQHGSLVLIAARPAMGKTSFALSIAKNVVIRNQKPVVIFSLEMSKTELTNRLLVMDSHVDSHKFKTGDLSEADWKNLVESGGKLSESPFIIDDTSTTIDDISSKCRKLKLEKDIQLVIIDYLQLMNGNGKSYSRQQEISEISRALKLMAKELQIPVIVLSQLARIVDSRPDKRPMLSDLRSSGCIDQDADVVLFIYRDDYYNKNTVKKDQAEIIIAKQHSGLIGTVRLAWLPQYNQFTNLAR